MENSVKLKVESTASNFDYWLSRPYVDEQLRQQLADANVLIVPWETYPGHTGPVFPQGTETVLSFLRENSGSAFVPDVCITDDDYLELILHHDVLELGMWVVSTLVTPVVIPLVVDYIKKRRSDDKAHIKITLTVVNADKTAKQISYEGPSEAFPQAVGQALLSTDNESKQPEHNDTE